jgi:hypothetical protein
MKDEEIVRLEARKLFSNNLPSARVIEPIDKFHEIKYRLDDFYTENSKATFLDEIKILLSEELQNHRDQKHGGKPDSECSLEIRAEKLLFYLNQELTTYPTIAHTKKVEQPQFKRDRVFICYSHLDKKYLEEIHRHFKPFETIINHWDDTKINPGEKWREKISEAINKTKVAILLVSTDFLGSEFIKNHELPHLLKAAEDDGAGILSVILKPCLFEEFPELNQYQAMNAPEKPISKMDDNEREDLYVNLVRQTKRILSETIID